MGFKSMEFGMDTERQRVRSYLLGVLPEQEAADLDQSLFTSDEVLRQMEDERELLIEDFINGHLRDEDKALFEKQCSRSPQLSDQVAETRMLIELLRRRTQERKATKGAMRWNQVFMILSPVLAVALGVVIFLYVQQRAEQVRLQATLQAQTSAPFPAAELGAGQPQIIAYLAATVVRGNESSPKITVPARAESVELQVEMRGENLTGNWSLTINQGNTPVWMSNRVPLHRLGAQTFLDAIVDANVLESGAYTMRIQSSQNPGAQQVRQFSVVRTN
jgi:hypothetical protein